MAIIYIVLGFPELYGLVPSRPPGSDLGQAIFRFLGAAILIAPLLIAAIVYPIGRLWAR